jgi:RND superfamily putative drug exporter
MFACLGRVITKHWLLVIVAWIVVLIVAGRVAPPWDQVTHDGDFAYLPPEMPSVVGEQLTREAFPRQRTKSEIVIVVSRSNKPLDADDLQVADRLSQRFYNFLGAAELRRGEELTTRATAFRREGDVAQARAADEDATNAFRSGRDAFNQAIDIDDGFAAALHNRALAHRFLGRDDKHDEDRHAAAQLDPKLAVHQGIAPADAAGLPLVDVWSRHTEVFGDKLGSRDKQAQLLILKLSNEFMETDNMRVLELVEREVDRIRAQLHGHQRDTLLLGISGSAAVGGDMLSAAAESIKNTELLTTCLVMFILLVVYRAPLLAAIPLITIAVSLSLSLDCLALLTQVDQISGMSWWDFKVFKTSKIFIVVILFGAGTDFCLFLIARYREELERGRSADEAVGAALEGVGSALSASAMTTVLGLGMMFFAEFGKFRNSGPAIGFCLAITLLASLTLAPALLRAMGTRVFWPFHGRIGPRSGEATAVTSLSTRVWQRLAIWIVGYPGRILVVSVLLLLPLAGVGLFTADHVTFDLLSELAPDRVSIRGTNLLKQHFPVGEGGPIVVLAHRHDGGLIDQESDVPPAAMEGIRKLTVAMNEIPGINSVRSLYEPLGDPPKRLSVAATMRIARRKHPLTKSLFLAQSPGHRGKVTRFELVLEDDPFSQQAMQTFARLNDRLIGISETEDSFWHGASFSYTGTTAGIYDLRKVTRSDNWRIRGLVVTAVFVVLLLVLRRPAICCYLIISVLFSYLVTIGATELFFHWAYGDTFQGLDWKVPIFLFVILVAIGEDYNIYLVTRVFEEQQRHGPFAGLRLAIVRTGGIITSCGMIMAGTFVSMTIGSLRGMIELGFALSLGIALDAFIVRPILVPAFLALLYRWQARASLRRPPP